MGFVKSRKIFRQHFLFFKKVIIIIFLLVKWMFSISKSGNEKKKTLRSECVFRIFNWAFLFPFGKMKLEKCNYKSISKNKKNTWIFLALNSFNRERVTDWNPTVKMCGNHICHTFSTFWKKWLKKKTWIKFLEKHFWCKNSKNEFEKWITMQQSWFLSSKIFSNLK